MSLYVILITQGSSPRCLSPNKVGLSQLQSNLKKPGRHEVKGKKEKKEKNKRNKKPGRRGRAKERKKKSEERKN